MSSCSAGNLLQNEPAVPEVLSYVFTGYESKSNRLHSPVPSGVQRDTSESGAKIGPYWIPGETIVAVPTYTIQRDQRYFVQPDEWIRERWFSKPELVINRHA